MSELLPVKRNLPVERLLAVPEAVPRRLSRLGTFLAWTSLSLVSGAIVMWFALDRGSLGSLDDHGPWPIVLALGFILGLLGAGCGVTALALGAAPRRAVGAVTISLVAPTLVGIVALGLFFASTTLHWV